MIVAQPDPDQFVELSRKKVFDGGVCWTPPVLLNGLIYCRNSLGSLICLDHRSPSLATATPEGAEKAELPKAEVLFAGHVKAIGGEAAWRKHRSMQLDGDIEILGAGITRTPMVIRSAAPALWHLNYSLGRFGEVNRGYDGEIAWQLDPFYGNRIEEGSALLEIEETRPFFAAFDWPALYESMATSGRVTFGDRPCWQVDALSRKGVQRQVYFDVDSGFQVGRSGATEAQVIFADYREFKGVSLPARITKLLPETGEEENYFIEKVTFDEVDPSVFELPPAVVKMRWTPEEIAVKDAEARRLYGTYLGTAEPVEGARFEVLIRRDDLLVSIEGRQEFALQGPDDEGWFTPEQGSGVAVRLEDEQDGVTETLRLRLLTGEMTLPREHEDEGD